MLKLGNINVRLFILCFITTTNTFTFIYTLQELRFPREALQFFVYIPGVIWTIQHFTDILAFKDHWPHHPTERNYLTFVNTIYKFEDEDGNRSRDALVIIRQLYRSAMHMAFKLHEEIEDL